MGSASAGRGVSERGGWGARSGVHPALFQIQLALELAEHLVVDRAFGTETEQHLALGADDGAADLAVLDQLAVLAVVGRIEVALDVLGAVPVRLAELIEERMVPRPDGIELVEALHGGVDQPLPGQRLLATTPDVRAKPERADQPR